MHVLLHAIRWRNIARNIGIGVRRVGLIRTLINKLSTSDLSGTHRGRLLFVVTDWPDLGDNEPLLRYLPRYNCVTCNLSARLCTLHRANSPVQLEKRWRKRKQREREGEKERERVREREREEHV